MVSMSTASSPRACQGIDVILTGHTHDALPFPVKVGKTLLVASGSHGKFLSRLDLDVRGRRIADFSYALIPVLADAIDPDPEMAALIRTSARRTSHARTELARTETRSTGAATSTARSTM